MGCQTPCMHVTVPFLLFISAATVLHYFPRGDEFLRNPAFLLLPNTTVLPQRLQTADDRSSMHVCQQKVAVRTVRREMTVEEGLAKARAAIRRAAASNASSAAPNIYRNAVAFFRSYKEMERRFKVYVYEEGEPPLVHDGPCKNIYTTEGRFIQELEMTRPSVLAGAAGRRRSIRTSDPKLAHAFFLPFSITMMVEYVYRPLSFDRAPITRFVADYVDVVASKYPYWNRTSGADHLMLSCHDWGPHASKANTHLYNTSIRALCNANTSEGFHPGKDVSIPEINLRTGELPPQLRSSPGGQDPPRPYLAFFSGGVHGPVRPVLLDHWKGKDDALQVFEYMPNGLDYFSFMRRSKFCLCPSGYEVASPRIVEAIYAECIPVVISEGYVLPFSDSDVLRWEEFSVSVEVRDVPRLKEVLGRVTEAEIRRLREGGRARGETAFHVQSAGGEVRCFPHDTAFGVAPAAQREATQMMQRAFF